MAPSRNGLEIANGVKRTTATCPKSLFTFLVRVVAAIFLSVSVAHIHAQTPTPTASPNPISLVSSSSKIFLVFPKTESPDGRYAVAWGLPKHPELWAKVCRFAEQHPVDTEFSEQDWKEASEVFGSVQEVEKDVENYIVDLHSETTIRTLHCPRGLGADGTLRSALSMEAEYWMTPGFHPNLQDLEVRWSPRSDLVLINHTFRWDCVSFCAVSLGQTPSELDLNRPLGDIVRSFTAKSFPKGSGYSKNHLDVSYSDLRYIAEDNFSVLAQAQMGKEWDGGNVTVNFTLKRSNAGKRLTVANIHVAD